MARGITRGAAIDRRVVLLGDYMPWSDLPLEDLRAYRSSVVRPPDLLWPLIVNSTPSRLPVSVGLANLEGQYVTEYQLIMAGAVIASAPIIVLFLLLQRQFISGLRPAG